MKLATALSRRKELQTHIHELEDRLMNNAQVQEGEEPAEDPRELLGELAADHQELERLISAINRTNDRTAAEGEKTLSDLLARRDCLRGQLGIWRNFLSCASATVSRRTVGEIKIRSTVAVKDFQKQVDQGAKELRQLEERIQELNWTTELLEGEGPDTTEYVRRPGEGRGGPVLDNGKGGRQAPAPGQGRT